MKSLFKVAGIILAALFAVSMLASATASAEKPAWEQCSEGGTATKYSEHQCTTASGTGKWQWNEVTGTEAVRIKGSLDLTDTKTLAGTSAVECSGESVGLVGPGKLGKITEVKTSAAQCRQLKVCENVEEIEARNLPWQTEMYETENKVLQKLGSGTGGEPGWKVKCKTAIGSITDECLQEAGEAETIELVNKATGSELLVLATFKNLKKAKCSQGGAKSGEVKGSLAILKENGWGLRVS